MVGTWEQQDWYAPGSRRKVAVSVARALSPIVASPASTAFVWTISSVRNGKQCSSNQELHGCANVSQSKPCQPQQRDTEMFLPMIFLHVFIHLLSFSISTSASPHPRDTIRLAWQSRKPLCPCVCGPFSTALASKSVPGAASLDRPLQSAAFICRNGETGWVSARCRPTP